MKDQASPMPLGAKLLSLRSSFLIARTKTRVSELRRLIKDLSLSPPEGRHWVGVSFLGPGDSKLEYFLHIDSTISKLDETVSHGFWIETSVREWPGPKPPADLVARPRFDRVHQGILKLAKHQRQLGFFDAEVSVPSTDHALPTTVVALPMTIGGRTLPVMGVEYGGDPDPGSVDGCRLTRTNQGMMLRLSYSREMDVTELPEILTGERDRIGTYVQEALAR